MATKAAAKKSATKSSAKKAAKSSHDAETYTDPELRERLKEEIKSGDKGGKPGQWSARKSQLLAREYEKAGGGYTHPGELSDAQKHLVEWTEEEWQTADGDARARHEDGSVERYLPKEAWDKLSPAQKAATNRKKIEASKDGEQFVPNTDAAAEATRDVRAEHEKPAKKRGA